MCVDPARGRATGAKRKAVPRFCSMSVSCLKTSVDAVAIVTLLLWLTGICCSTVQAEACGVSGIARYTCGDGGVAPLIIAARA
jgi:hypothetical protein